PERFLPRQSGAGRIGSTREVGAMAVDGTRDRDGAGRPRNARPRDELGRPLPHGVPGVATTPDDLRLPPDRALAEAQRLLAAGRPFHAHEVLEGTWKAAPEGERELWRGLAQLAVGITHLRRGNPVGATGLLRRAADRIEAYADRPPHRIDAAGLTSWARTLVARIERDGPDAVPDTALTPRLIG
ncbi:MAG TPA: DUF309 domain-containing protein, partial [Micromonospora sp.]